MRARLIPASDSSWTIRVELPPDIDGRRKQKRLTFKGTKREAQAAAERFLAVVIRGEFVDPGKTTVSELLDRWLASRRTRVERSTMERYESLVEDHIRPVLGPVMLSSLNSKAIDQALERWKTTPRRDRKKGLLGLRTVHHIFATFSTICNAGVRWELIGRNPCRLVEPVPLGARKVKGLHGPDVPTLFEGLAGTALFEPSLVAAFAGLRRGEVLGLHWTDIDLNTGAVDVQRALDEGKDGSLALKDLKTEQSRRAIVIPEFVLAELRRHRSDLEEQFGPKRMPIMVFPNLETGDYWSPDVLSSAFYYRVRSKQLPRVSFHGLRHTCSNLLQSAGVQLVVTSRILGHSDVTTTGNIYTDVPAPEVFEAARRLDVAFRGAVGSRAVCEDALRLERP